MMPSRMSRPAQEAFRFAAYVAVLAVGCGGRTTGSSGGATGLASGTTTGSTGAASGSAGLTSGASAGVTSGSSPCQDNGLCDCSNGQIAGGCCACSVASAGVTGGTTTGRTGAASGAATGTVGGCSDMGTIHANMTSWECGCDVCWCEHDTITETTIVCPSVDAGAGKDAGPSEPPSCVPGGPGMTNCGGPVDTGTESCCTSLEVTGGTYYRTYASAPDGGATELAGPATVSDFRLDKYDVTVARFREFANAWKGGWRPLAGSGKHSHLNGGMGLAAEPNADAGQAYEPGWIPTDDGNIASNASLGAGVCLTGSTWTEAPSSQENLPINCVDWYASYAFCIWDGGFLPSEAEWEYAAAGGSQQREYPWGSTDPGLANQYAIYSCLYPNGELQPSERCIGVANIAPVGMATLGAGLWGQLDLAGEVNEWNLDWYSTYVDPCMDCAALPATGSSRVTRGSSFDDSGLGLLPTFRVGEPPGLPSGLTGFRCARTP
jgi:sulfatase modifying factor 1